MLLRTEKEAHLSRIHLARNHALKITVIYILVGSLWIIFSDMLTEQLIPERYNIMLVSIIKGILYVLSTSALLYGLIYSALKKLTDSEEKLNKSETLFRTVFNQAPIGIAISYSDRPKYVEDEIFPSINPMFEKITGRTKSELVRVGWDAITHPEDLKEEIDLGVKLHKGEIDSYKKEKRYLKPDGSIIWASKTAVPLFLEEDFEKYSLFLIQDITESKQHEMKLKFMGEHDVLTGLYNRRFFEEFLVQEEDSGQNVKRAVLLLDLKKINSFNMAYGYNYSENLIKEITTQLSLSCNGDCRLFQISFERIAFYLKNYGDRNKLITFCDRLLGLLEKMQVRQTLDCNIGILEIGGCSCDADDILKNVSIAAAKSAENREVPYYFFEDKLEEKLTRESLIKEELITVARDENDNSIYLLYQPIFEAKSKRIYAFEALARFESKNLGIVYPSEFISLAEESQMIIPLGKRILHKACIFLKELETLGYNEVAIAVNVSAIQMLRSDFVKDVKSIIAETAINPSMLTLEVTESTFLNSYESVKAAIDKLRELGIKFSIDDFGVGYSSLARERELKVDCVKLDKYFADDLLSHKPEEVIAGDIISMMHRFGHTVVAEGIEEERQKEYLAAHNCDYLQGYLFSKPIRQEMAVELLKETNKV